VTIAGIDHVQLAAPVGCEVEARGFFGGVLGMREIHKPETLAGRGGVWFACGDQELHVGVESNFTPAHKAHPAFRVVDLTALRTRIEEAGVHTTADDAIPGVRRFYTQDPFGNRLEFTEQM